MPRGGFGNVTDFVGFHESPKQPSHPNIAAPKDRSTQTSPHPKTRAPKEMAREEEQSAVGTSVASHRKHSTTIMPHTHTHTTLLAPPAMRTLRVWYNEEGA